MLCPGRVSLGNTNNGEQNKVDHRDKAKESWQRIKLKAYSIVKHLEKTPTKILVTDLLMSSEYHRK